MVKLVWRVQPEPTGQFRSFERRGWPTADFEDGRTAARLECEDDYVPRLVRLHSHGVIRVYVADHRPHADGSGFKWRRLRAVAHTLDGAKRLAAETFDEIPSLMGGE